MSEKSGGPAFPSSIIHEGHSHIVGFLGEQIEPGETSNYAGMSLRDYFAAKAMQGQMQREKDFGKTVREQGFDKYAAHIAETSYQLADAMLLERAK